MAIDGPVGSGKSAVGRRLAERVGFRFVDSGLMYRAVAVIAARQQEGGGDDDDGLVRIASQSRIEIDGDRVRVDGEDLGDAVFSTDISGLVSRVAAVPGVRTALVAEQRRLRDGDLVMAGRDIGTVVFPDAELKVFLTASLGERVRRRAVQLERRGETPDRDAMAREVADRDAADAGRAVSPLRPAPDAVVLETDQLDVDAVVDRLADLVRAR